MRIITTVLFSILFTIGLYAKVVERDDIQYITGSYENKITKFIGNIEDYRDDKGEIVIEIGIIDNAPGVGGGWSVRSIGEGAFENLGIDKVIFWLDINRIGKSAFANNKIKELIFKDMDGGTQLTIEDRAFENNQLTEVALPKYLFSARSYAFCNNKISSYTCESYRRGVFAEGVFKDNNFTKLPMANEATYIGPEAFANNKIKSIEWDNDNFPLDFENHPQKLQIYTNSFKGNPDELFPLALRKGSTKEGEEICWTDSNPDRELEVNELHTEISLEDSKKGGVKYSSLQLKTAEFSFKALQPITYATEQISPKVTTTVSSKDVHFSSSDYKTAYYSDYYKKLIIEKPGIVNITAKIRGNVRGYDGHRYKPYAVTHKLVITKAPLQVSVDNATRKVGEENPEFVINYSGFVRGESKYALSKQATASTEATTTSAEGKYPIALTSPVSENYEFTLNNGVLTVEDASHSISYVLNGGTVSGTNPSSYKESVGVSSFKPAVKTHYAFEGWYSDAAFKSKVTSIAAGSTSNYTLYAKFIAKTHSISYVLNGGTVSGTNPTSYNEHEGVTSLKSATKAHYTFDGWYSDAAFTNKVSRIAVGSTSNYTLYAKFVAKTHSINYVLNGGTVSGTNPTSYNEHEGVTSFKSATKAHYTFDGWYSDAAYTNKVSRIAVGSTSNYTLYAKFIAKSHTIIYELNGGTPSGTNPTSYNEHEGVSSFRPATKTFYTFDGWYSDAAFTKKVTSIAVGSSLNYTLYAKYTRISHTISYELNGGRNASSNPTSYEEGIGVRAFASATKKGFNFEGWYSDAAFTSIVLRIPNWYTTNVTLYAKFEAITHTIQYVLDGGSNAPGNPTSYEESVGVASFAPATKAGFTFEGWYSDATFNNKVESFASGTENDLTLYAKWGKATAINKDYVTVIKVYPNPATSVINITSADKTMVQLSLINSGGNTVLQKATNSEKEQLQVSHLGKGMYFVKIAFADGSEKVQKVMIK